MAGAERNWSHGTTLEATPISAEKPELEAPGLAELTGRGVYYGSAMTEAPNCRDQDVYIVGGANSAGKAAVYFSRYARRVHLLVRGASLEASIRPLTSLPFGSRSEYSYVRCAAIRTLRCWWRPAGAPRRRARPPGVRRPHRRL